MSQPPLDRRALGLALSRLANARPDELMRLPLRDPPPARAQRIGITGAPGAGKSTLLGHLAVRRAARGRVGVLAVDPSSPKTGGAILGDRIRMDELPGVGELYIRSVGSRGTTDGLADNLPEMLDTMDDFGFTEVMLETVGVGQAEFAARVQVDTLVLVLLPGSGDIVQAMKAGIAEMADIVVVNKADLPGAQQMAADVRRIASMTPHPPGAWVPRVLLASSTQPESIERLSAQVDRHQQWLAEGQHRDTLLEQRARYRLKRLLEMYAAAVLGRSEAAFFQFPIKRQLTLALQAMADAVAS